MFLLLGSGQSRGGGVSRSRARTQTAAEAEMRRRDGSQVDLAVLCGVCTCTGGD